MRLKETNHTAFGYWAINGQTYSPKEDAIYLKWEALLDDFATIIESWHGGASDNFGSDFGMAFTSRTIASEVAELMAASGLHVAMERFSPDQLDEMLMDDAMGIVFPTEV